MALERVVSMGERLQRLLDGAEKEAEVKVADAEKSAEEMVAKAKTDSERRRSMAQRGYGIDELLKEAEEDAKKEAKKLIKDFTKKAETVKEVSEDKMEEAVALVLGEVIPS